MTFANCPKCGSSNVTTAGVCANCGWTRFPQVMGAGESKEAIYNLVGEIEIKVTGKALLDDYKRLLFENKSLESHIAELGEQVWNLNLENERMEEAYWIDESIAPDGTLKPSVRKLLERLEKAETDLRLGDDLVKALDNRIAELEEFKMIVEGCGFEVITEPPVLNHPERKILKGDGTIYVPELPEPPEATNDLT